MQHQRGGKPINALSHSDPRVSTPLFTVTEAAVHLGVSPSKLRWWATDERLVTRLDAAPRHPSIPFIGLAEAVVLLALRQSGVPLQRIRPALEGLKSEIGLDHALASRSLYTDGAEIMYDYACHHEDVTLGDLVVVRSGQRVFAPVVVDFLKRITWAADGWPGRIELPRYRVARVMVDPRHAFGQPVFAHGVVRIEDVVDRWRAGDSLLDLAGDFGVPVDEIEDVLRAA